MSAAKPGKLGTNARKLTDNQRSCQVALTRRLVRSTVAACATSSGLARSKFGDPLPRHTPVHFGQRKCYLCAEIERVIPNKDRGNFPMTRLLIVMIVLGAAVVPARSQSAAATPDSQVSALQAQIELLQKQ